MRKNTQAALAGAPLSTMMKFPRHLFHQYWQMLNGVNRMSEHLLEPELRERAHAAPGRRHRPGPDEQLVLTDLDPDTVIDHLEPPDALVELITFGTVRETCPKCATTHLKLVLRQRRVRLAHLFCSQCQCCFDARYTNGRSALTI
jgi:hypothetical protein